MTDEEEDENHHDRDVENLDKFFKLSKVLLKVEVERLCGFIHSWFQRCFEFYYLTTYSFFELISNLKVYVSGNVFAVFEKERTTKDSAV